MFMGQGVQTFPSKYKNRFDLITGTGVFLPKHIPSLAFYDAHAALKLVAYFVLLLDRIFGTMIMILVIIMLLISLFPMEFLHHVSKEFWRGKEEGISLFERQQSKLFALKNLQKH